MSDPVGGGQEQITDEEAVQNAIDQAALDGAVVAAAIFMATEELFPTIDYTEDPYGENEE